MSMFLLSFATFVVTVQSNEAGCTIAVVGSSPASNTKSITIDSRFRCPTTVDKTNWLDGKGIYSVAQVGNQITVTRKDDQGYYDGDWGVWTIPVGWDKNLEFRCCSGHASCQEKCVADWTGGTPDCIKREACQRACNAGTCPEYNK